MLISYFDTITNCFSASGTKTGLSKVEKSRKSWEPYFVEQVPNITVAAGKDATMSCQVDNLHGYKVWHNTLYFG